MKFRDWIFSSYPNPHVDGQWGALHICVLIACILVIVGITLLFRYVKTDVEKKKRITLFVIAGILLFFELTRRIIGFILMKDPTFTLVMRTLLPRPWCAISVWMVIVATIVNKKFFYNFASITSILGALIFFAYPGVGFNNEYILFENLYSILSHSLFMVGAVLFITLKFTDFTFKGMWKELICLGAVYVYGTIEIFVLQIEKDPLYFMPGNEIMELFGMGYGLYIVLYVLFIAVFWLAFYLIQDRKTVAEKLFKKKTN